MVGSELFMGSVTIPTGWKVLVIVAEFSQNNKKHQDYVNYRFFLKKKKKTDSTDSQWFSFII